MEMIFWILVILNLIMGVSLVIHKKMKKIEMMITIGLPILLIYVYYNYECNIYMKTGLLAIYDGVKSGLQGVYITLLILLNLFLLTFVNIGKVVMQGE